jgi:L-lactate dehydrogenase
MKVGVVGAGLVGSTAAFAMVMRGVGREIVLIDKSEQRAVAEAEDLYHAVPYAAPLLVRAGDYAALDGAHVVIVAAGVNQQPGETRLQLLERNAAVFAEVVPQVLKHAPGAVIVVATNPVDIMTHYTTRIAEAHGVATQRVFGSGTTLDTARFRALIAQYTNVDSAYVNAYVVGEHGDSEVLAWSQVTIGGLALERFLRETDMTLSAAERTKIDEGVRKAAYRIIEGKRATYYGIGAALAEICDVIINDRHSIMTVCMITKDVFGVQDVTLSLPRLVSGRGATDTIALPLQDAEAVGLRRSAEVLHEAIQSLPAVK